MGLRPHAGAGLKRQRAKRTIAKVEGGGLPLRGESRTQAREEAGEGAGWLSAG